MQLNSVDLPQPFGPINPRISPSCTSKLTPSTAVMPPNRLRDVADFEHRGHGAVSSLDCADRAQRGGDPGAALGEDSDRECRECRSANRSAAAITATA